MTTNETETTETASPQVIPPEAYERQKAETAAAKAQVAEATEALAQTALVDSVYEYFNGLDEAAKPANPYEAAKNAARRIPVGTENVPEAVAALVAEMSSLQPPTVIQQPPPPMAGTEGSGPQPGAAGGEIESGPFPMNGKEAMAFRTDQGEQAFRVAVANGMFYPSDANASAQATLDSV